MSHPRCWSATHSEYGIFWIPERFVNSSLLELAESDVEAGSKAGAARAGRKSVNIDSMANSGSLRFLDI
jgi:hypothetical protein